MMDELTGITSLGDEASPLGPSGDKPPGRPRDRAWRGGKDLGGGAWRADPDVAKDITGVELPSDWSDRLDLFLDTVRARWVQGGPLPFSLMPMLPGPELSLVQAGADCIYRDPGIKIVDIRVFTHMLCEFLNPGRL